MPMIVLCLVQFMLVLDDTVVNVALPSIRDDLGFSTSGLPWVVNAYFLAFGGLLCCAAGWRICWAAAASSSWAWHCSGWPAWPAASRRSHGSS
ncbi:hypothetical protein ACLQ2P_30435 [Actinomadura citrea]|uniref:hypothetical protein n=1 Tax=Actinomadura citrea TaxID=46158 RepID=UPI003CE48BB9